VSNRVAIVTGGASGIGNAIARRLAADGAAVAILDRNGEAAKTAASKIEADGGDALGVTADVTVRSELDVALEAVKTGLGLPSILVNAAGIVHHGPFLELTLDTWNRILNINLTGQFNVSQAVIPLLVQGGWGRVVNISSSVVHSGAPYLTSYAAAKSGVVGLTKALALEFARDGITVNSVAPGATDTPMFRGSASSGSIDVERIEANVPVGRIGQPDDIAATVAFLVSDEAGYITGQLVGVNGGINT